MSGDLDLKRAPTTPVAQCSLACEGFYVASRCAADGAGRSSGLTRHLFVTIF